MQSTDGGTGNSDLGGGDGGAACTAMGSFTGPPTLNPMPATPRCAGGDLTLTGTNLAGACVTIQGGGTRIARVAQPASGGATVPFADLTGTYDVIIENGLGSTSFQMSVTPSGTWTQLPANATKRDGPAAAPVTINGAAGVLLIGGTGCSNTVGANLEYKTVEFFTRSANAWSPVISMSTARQQPAAAPVTIGGVAGVLVVGGQDTTPAILASTEFFNPATGGWNTMAPMSKTRLQAVAAPVTVNGVAGVLVAGGVICLGCTPRCVGDAEFYDPTMDKWTPLTGMTGGRFAAAAAPVTMNGVAGVLVAGGHDCGTNGGAELDTAEFYDPGANTWTPVATMSTPRYDLAAAPATVNGVAGVIATGGYTTTSLMLVEFFNPAANGWLPLTALPTVRFNHGSAAISDNGGVVVADGNSCTSSDAQLYCP